MYESQPTCPPAQRGAALITALLLLLVMTILAVTVMQMSRMQERMAGNTRDSNVAFESAEAALRNAETLIGKQAVAPITCSAAPCQFWADGSVGDVANQPKDWWTANATAFADGTGSAMTGVAENPLYVIEHRAQVSTSSPNKKGVPFKGRDFYQITARSTGASGQANTVIQTTFAKKF
jgi:type IV pilus assembly protein PilX